MISYSVEGVKRPNFPRRLTSAWIRRVAELHGKQVGNIAYLFCTEDRMLDTNRTYLQHDYYTDIITFDYSEGDTISGDAASSSTASYTSAASTTKPPEPAPSWSATKTKPSPCSVR